MITVLATSQQVWIVDLSCSRYAGNEVCDSITEWRGIAINWDRGSQRLILSADYSAYSSEFCKKKGKCPMTKCTKLYIVIQNHG